MVCLWLNDCVFPQHMVLDHSCHTGSEPLTVGWTASVSFMIEAFRKLHASVCFLCLSDVQQLLRCSSLRAVRSLPVSTLVSLPHSSLTSSVTPKGGSREKVSAARLVRLGSLTDRIWQKEISVLKDIIIFIISSFIVKPLCPTVRSFKPRTFNQTF